MSPRFDRVCTFTTVAFGLGWGGYYFAQSVIFPRSRSIKSLTRLSLEATPETGRRRFMALSEGDEALLQRSALQETLEKYRDKILPFSHPLTQQVRRITQRIILSSNLGYLYGEPPQQSLSVNPGAFSGLSAEIPRSPVLRQASEWIVLVVDDPQFVNAFAASGLVCISTGILPVVRDEVGLAAVIAHEIAHVTLRHSAELTSRDTLLFPAGCMLVLLGLMFRHGIIASSSILNLVAFIPTIGQCGAILKILFLTTSTTDIVGLKLMSRACYDPAAAPRFFEDLSRIEQSAAPKFLRTHPPTDERIAQLKALLPQNYEIYMSSPECLRLEEMRSRRILGRVRMYRAVY
ncbi:peptidase family M48-domain-containing protein [Mycena metata]|uniref:Peptidase family M48-domain-containing protein n=1 Tax=Mycena metata TaxID=1033252 RepID=A0AAD7JI24_9AGAR|nr:peptidase family M48-domain-containing protein [Mycena metata]